LVEIEAQWESKFKQTLSEAEAHHHNLEAAKAELGEAIAKLKESHAERDDWQARANQVARKGKGVIVAYITQSPLCSRINLNKDDFDNSTNLFIADNIPRALSEELNNKLSDKEIAYLMKQYELRKERGDEYICLVKLPRSKTTSEALIATLPPPGYYAKKLSQKIAEAAQSFDISTHSNGVTAQAGVGDEHPSLEVLPQQDYHHVSPPSPPSPTLEKNPPIAGGCFSLQCPICQSSNIVKNGKKRGIQYYECSACSKQFSS
jgi:hypothetical protein